MGKENKKVKNSVLIDLFCDDESAEKNDIALYNALHDEPLPEGTQIEKIYVDNVLYMNFRNDISFGAGGKVIVMGEHQSTLNENMPLRSLMYVWRTYEKIVPVRDRYKKSRVPLPKPEFFTFYNGKDYMEKEKVMFLSDAYIVQDGDPMLELKVRVININSSAKHEILDKCQVLKEYSLFIDTIRKYQEQGMDNAYALAIRECINAGILADYLKKRGSEVENMLCAEYDYEMDIEVQREEAYEDGKQKGISEGEQLKLVTQVIKKMQKGYTSEVAADMLEEDVAVIRQIYEISRKYAPEYDAKKICMELENKLQK